MRSIMSSLRVRSAWALLAAMAVAPAAFAEPSAERAADAGVTVSGVVLRAPVAATKPPPPARYRSRHVPTDESESEAPDCGCDPGKFVVVHLTGENLPPLRMPLSPPAMAQKDRRFEPAVLAVPVGADVEFPNRDPFFHNVFSYSKVRAFDLGRYPEGETATVCFPEPGIIPVFCEIHYSMRAYVHVFDTPYFAVSDERRRFEIPDVLPGEYVLHVWQENLPEITIALSVGDEPVRVDVP